MMVCWSGPTCQGQLLVPVHPCLFRNPWHILWRSTVHNQLSCLLCVSLHVQEHKHQMYEHAVGCWIKTDLKNRTEQKCSLVLNNSCVLTLCGRSLLIRTRCNLLSWIFYTQPLCSLLIHIFCTAVKHCNNFPLILSLSMQTVLRAVHVGGWGLFAW